MISVPDTDNRAARAVAMSYLVSGIDLPFVRLQNARDKPWKELRCPKQEQARPLIVILLPGEGTRCHVDSITDAFQVPPASVLSCALGFDIVLYFSSPEDLCVSVRALAGLSRCAAWCRRRLGPAVGFGLWSMSHD